ncbi:bifunctional riboflavin kinase/FAD synthetase [Motilibacter aurantiacus]|uniref:bifunctional riboflavin kinase/FAD synthetase n=1 Tax=Motilibacter aurantiacus TaxID=2714955 RepID=UPI0014077387|nr:bifunctional riboflavin kinase/FAD synthetase [Motilibacter aurantiacus]
MQVWHGLGAIPSDWGPSVVSIGVFDGVHRGHRAVVGRAVARSRSAHIPAVVVTFDPHPLDVLRPQIAPKQLTTVAHRAALLGDLGVDAVCVLPFDAELASWSPEQFVGRVLVDALHAAEVVVGADFRFGHKAAGDAALLSTLGARSGFTVCPVGLVEEAGHRWSSTFVRDRVALGEVEAAARALDRPHRVEGVVVHGDKRGRELGYPTANLDVPARTVVPADGVYAGWLVRGLPHNLSAEGETRLPAAISIGTNPTFGGEKRRVEAYVLDRTDLDLYGEHVAVDFVGRVRDTEKFAGVEELVAQMALDVDRVRELLR